MNKEFVLNKKKPLVESDSVYSHGARMGFIKKKEEDIGN
jgi:hypothetical protein